MKPDPVLIQQFIFPVFLQHHIVQHAVAELLPVGCGLFFPGGFETAHFILFKISLPLNIFKHFFWMRPVGPYRYLLVLFIGLSAAGNTSDHVMRRDSEHFSTCVFCSGMSATFR